jgi:hypothetical protein
VKSSTSGPAAPFSSRISPVSGTRPQGCPDNDADYIDPRDVLSELWEDSKTLAMRLS